MSDTQALLAEYDIQDILEKNKKHLWHHLFQHSVLETRKPQVFVEGEGARVRDIHGKEYLDASGASTWDAGARASQRWSTNGCCVCPTMRAWSAPSRQPSRRARRRNGCRSWTTSTPTAARRARGLSERDMSFLDRLRRRAGKRPSGTRGLHHIPSGGLTRSVRRLIPAKDALHGS